jgi:hypothetical protein
MIEKVNKIHSLKIHIKYLLLFILTLALFSCLGDPDGDSPIGAVPDKPADTTLNPFTDPAETAITDINLAASVEYDSATGLVTCYIKAYDQNNNQITTFNEDNFEIITNNTIIPNTDRTFTSSSSTTKLVGLILDSSGSMSAGTRQADTIQAATLFVNNMAGADETAYIDFDSSATLKVPLTTDKAALTAAIALLDANGGTNIGGGLIEASNAVGARPGKTAGILLTDGEDNGGVIQQGINKAKAIGLKVYTIFLGDDITATARADLQQIATDTTGDPSNFFEVPSTAVPPNDLNTIFSTTIPSLIDAQPAGSAITITFTNQFPANNFVQVLISARYLNSWGWHTTDFGAQYFVTP